MCSVSVISNYGIEKVFPNIVNLQPWINPGPSLSGLTSQKLITLTEYNELIRKAKEFDEKTNQPHCPDPVKMAAVEEFCKKFELMGTEMFRLANELRNLLK